MTRKKTIILIVSLVVVAAIGFVALWQRNNISALLLYQKYSKTELEEKIAENEQASEDALSKLPGDIKDLTEDEKQQLDSGEITPEEAVKLILEHSDSEDGDPPAVSTAAAPVTGTVPADTADSSVSPVYPTEADGPPASSAVTPTPTAVPAPIPVPESPETQRIKELVAQLYVLRETFTNSLDRLVQQAVNEYTALPKSEHTSAGKQMILKKYIGQATDLETACDAKVNAITIELNSLLQKTGGDLSVIDTIKNTYNAEKSIKKAYYMNMLNGNRN